MVLYVTVDFVIGNGFVRGYLMEKVSSIDFGLSGGELANSLSDKHL